jgi:alpha-beta hydrolase superfamily lysophospholipase
MTLSWQAPAGLATRGTVVVLPGRGEHAGVYERFGRRLASDAYAVHALDAAPEGSQETQQARQTQDPVSAAHELVTTLVSESESTTPLVLVGSDTGALLALLLADAVPVDGLILAALPDPDEPVITTEEPDSDWDWELAARTTCPTHRARLADDEAFVRGALAEPIPAPLARSLDEATLKAIDMPVLVLHGGADPVASVGHALRVAEALPRAEIAVVGSAPHDVLNDATHRTVAAHVVQWLERLRGGPQLAPIISVLSAEPVLRR